MVGSRAGAWVPLPCLTPSASGRACERDSLAGWRRDGTREEERRGRSKRLGLGFWGQGMQAVPPGSSVTANDAELEEVEGGGGLKTVTKKK